ncbi:S-layer homology domain-containing protein [Fenollaria massiliensis]|uniref:S-layer homology domain-containing protein n=1 Tax=Fenollaria massiliensis TaxID=938288 RepID=A0A9E7IUE8_9FIRM|nr:S-layer homology domain-containing protein [Fenollaria massiliensis]UQK58942.1 S-layer homology domain-containing protein [Fenollaria massiliensis]
MNKLKRIISIAFIIAFALSQFESIKAESVKADMTDAKNAETVVASEEAEKEEVKQDAQDVQDPQVAGCQTQDDVIKELEEALKNKIESVNTKNDDYVLRLNKLKDVDVRSNQNPDKYVAHYELLFTIVKKDKKFSEIDMDSLAGAITDLYREGKIDKLKFKLDEKEGNDLKKEIGNLNETQTKDAIKDMIYEGLKGSMSLNDDTKLESMNNHEGGIRLSKKACKDKEAFLWLRIPFRNAIVNEIKDKIEAKDITVNKNDKVNWENGVKIKDSVTGKEDYQKYINNAKVTDESNRDTKTAGEKLGKIKLKFTDDTELTLDNQKLIVKEDKKAEENNNKDNNKEKEQIPQIKDKENNKFDRYDRYDRNDKNNKNDKHDRNDKYDKKHKTDKNPKKDKNIESEEKQEEKQEKMDYGILVPAQALRLVQHKDLPQGEKGEAIRELIARGILSGVSDTEFKGKLAINRAMLAQVLMTISKDKSVGFIDYLDIKGDEWYADAMTWALTHGIYKGYTDKTVKAAQNITRQEFASVIYNFIKEHNINMPKIKNFNYKDQDQIASWALNQVKYLDEIGLVSGASTDTYNAKGTYTREELALTIYKIIKFIENK